jgi:hypothetical protein
MMEAAEEKKGQRSFWSTFYNFLACGGFLLVLVFIVGIVVLVSILTK